MDPGKSNSQGASTETLAGSYISSPHSGVPLKFLSQRSKSPVLTHGRLSYRGWGIFGKKVYTAPIPSFEKISLTITHLEILNLVVALRAWGKFWRNSTVKIFCDSMVDFLAGCIRNIWLLAATFDIDLHI